MVKLFKTIILIAIVLIVLGSSYLALVNYQCKQYFQGVPDSELQFEAGITLLKSTGKPYTGIAYATVCGGDCGFMSCTLLHWRAEYKDGLLHGQFDAPISGVGDKHWFHPGDETATHIYENGARVQ